jgi:hypothetical protein
MDFHEFAAMPDEMSHIVSKKGPESSRPDRAVSGARIAWPHFEISLQQASRLPKRPLFILQAFFAHQLRPERGLAAIWRSIRVRRVSVRMTISHHIGAVPVRHSNGIPSSGDPDRAGFPHDPPNARCAAAGTGLLAANLRCFF